jgi:hypothetical protein
MGAGTQEDFQNLWLLKTRPTRVDGRVTLSVHLFISWRKLNTRFSLGVEYINHKFRLEGAAGTGGGRRKALVFIKFC